MLRQETMLRQDDAGKASFTVIYQLPPQLNYLYMFPFKPILIIALCEMYCQKVTLSLAQVRANK